MGRIDVELLRLRFDPLQHILGLLAGAQQDDAFDRVVLLLEAELAQARSDADRRPRPTSFTQHRRAVVHREHDVADVLQGRSGRAAHVIELATLRIEAAAGVAVVGAERALHLRDRQARAREAIS